MNKSDDGAGARKPEELRKYFVETIDHLYWALDLINMYDRRLIQLGDPKEQVCSAVHIDRMFGARNTLEASWQALNEKSVCSSCRDGNIPLNGWHKYSGGTHPNDPGDVPCVAERGEIGSVPEPLSEIADKFCDEMLDNLRHNVAEDKKRRREVGSVGQGEPSICRPIHRAPPISTEAPLAGSHPTRQSINCSPTVLVGRGNNQFKLSMRVFATYLISHTRPSPRLAQSPKRVLNVVTNCP
jgi:hypothetical protein